MNKEQEEYIQKVAYENGLEVQRVRKMIKDHLNDPFYKKLREDNKAELNKNLNAFYAEYGTKEDFEKKRLMKGDKE